MFSYQAAGLNDLDHRIVLRCITIDGEIYSLRNDDITLIQYHAPMGEGDKHFVDVYYNDGAVKRIMNIKEINYATEELIEKYGILD